MQDGQMQPLEVNIHDVDVVVSIPGRTSVSEEARTKVVTQKSISEQQQKHLEKLVSEYGNVARRAFDLWIRTLRWKADDSRIGLPEVIGVETGWGTEIREKDTPNRIWAGGKSLIIYVGKTVTVEVWNEVSAALNAGESPPIYYDFLYDAMAHLERGDFQRTVVDAAVAAETYMRTIVQEGLPIDLDASLQEYINEANIRQVVEKFFPERLDMEQRKTFKKTLKSKLHQLFDDRNDIMHLGQKEGLTKQHCRRIIKSVSDLLSLEPYKAT
jgi:hypothetical protein